MEELKNNIRNKFDSLGWSNDGDKWVNERKVMVNQGTTIIINGQQIQQRGQEKVIKQSFEITGNCEIEDVESKEVELSVMCKWEVMDGDEVIGYLEINIDDYDTFNMYCNKIFGV